MKSNIFENTNPSLLYGPGFVATTENISSILINPAGLYRILYTEFIINFNEFYKFNYIAFGHFYKNFGNIGISFYNDEKESKKYTTFAYGSKLYKSIIIGFNISGVSYENYNSISINPGILLYFKRKRKTLRKISIGFSTFNLADKYANTEYNLALSLTFQKTKRTIISLGNNFNSSFHHKWYSFNTEFELLKYFFVNLGIRNDGFIIGNNLKRRDDNIYAGLLVNIGDNQSMKFSITYRRLIHKPFKNLKKKKVSYRKTKKTYSKKSKTKTKKSQNKQLSLSDEELIQQRELLEQGIEFYSNDKLYEALDSWKKVLEIGEDTEYANQAKINIELVKKEIKKIKSK